MKVQKWIFHNSFPPRQAAARQLGGPLRSPARLVVLNDRFVELPGVRGKGDKGARSGHCCSQTTHSTAPPQSGMPTQVRGVPAADSRLSTCGKESACEILCAQSAPAAAALSSPRAPRVRSSAGFRARALCAERRTGQTVVPQIGLSEILEWDTFTTSHHTAQPLRSRPATTYPFHSTIPVHDRTRLFSPY